MTQNTLTPTLSPAPTPTPTSAPTPALLLETNVSSTILEKAKIVSPLHTSVTITPDLASTAKEPSKVNEVSNVNEVSKVNDESKPFRIGTTPNVKDKVKAISTSKMRIEYKYLEERLSSKYERMVSEGIECLHKIGYDLRYYYSSIQELVRGLDDERPIIREGCVRALSNLGTRRLENAINAQVTKTISFLSTEDADSYKKSVENMWKEIDANNDRRLAMIRIYEANNRLHVLQSNVPHLFVFHVDYRISKSKITTKTVANA